MNKRILILYMEYAGYLEACLRKFISNYGYEVHVVRYPRDSNAPFQDQDTKNIFFYVRDKMSEQDILALYKSLDPSVVLVSGWGDRVYNRVAKKVKNEGKTVIAVVDNQWVGSWRQKFSARFAQFFLNARFTHYWIPGTTQFEFMRKMAIKAEKIQVGYYSADSDLFSKIYVAEKPFKKRFIYVGRLLDIKGTPVLIKAIEMINKTVKSDWEFLIVGNGKYEKEIKELAGKYSNLQYLPFLQPADLAKKMSEGGVFILPSNYDAWGVVVHEFALMGFPLVVSSMVGSRYYFVTPGYNGYHFEAGNAGSLAFYLKKMMQLDDATLKEMGRRSHVVGQTITTDAWAARLNSFIETSQVNS